MLILLLGEAIDPLLDSEPVNMKKLLCGSFQQRIAALKSVASLARTGNFLNKIYFCWICSCEIGGGEEGGRFGTNHALHKLCQYKVL